MFEEFPVICLSDQLEAINYVVNKNDLSQQNILHWLSLYGEVVEYYSAYTFKSHFGFYSLIYFVDDSSSIKILRSGYI